MRALFCERDKEIRFNANDPELGTALEEMEVEIKGDEMELAFNAEYMLDVLKVINEDQVEIKLLDPEKPCLVKIIDRDNYLYLIMPIRIKEG